MCSIESVNGIMKALAPTYNIRVFTKHKLPEDFFDDVELVVFPGGVGDASSFGSLLKANLDDVKKFLSLGGKYLGICMGAYWADKYYFDILNAHAPKSDHLMLPPPTSIGEAMTIECISMMARRISVVNLSRLPATPMATPWRSFKVL